MPHTAFYINGFDRASSNAEEFSGAEMAGWPTFPNNTWGYQPAYGGYGRYLFCPNTGDMIRIAVPSPPPEAVGAGFLFGTNMGSSTSRLRILDLWDAAAASAALSLDLVFDPGTGRAHLELMAGSTLLVRANAVIETGGNRWQWISLMASPSMSSGQARVRVNGSVVINHTGRTIASAGMSYTHVRLGQISATGSATQLFFDNLVLTSCLASDAPLVEARVVNGTSYSAQQTSWTPNTGTNVSAVSNDTPDGDSTYVSANVSGQTDLFSAAAWPSIGDQILAVRVSAVARRDDAGVQKLRNLLRIGGQVYEGPEQEIGPNYFRYSNLWPVNPATGQSWQSSEAGPALVFGYRVA